MKERGLRPWRKITRNSSERAANTVEKLWLVTEMVLHGETAKDLSNLYGIGRKVDGLKRIKREEFCMANGVDQLYSQKK